MTERKMIYLDDAIDALKALAIPLHLDSACEDIWERDRTIDNAIDAMRGLPAAQPESCEGCKHKGNWENEVEYGYTSPCTCCKRRVEDNYER